MLYLDVLFTSCLFTLARALTQYQTNGASQWGTLAAPTLPLFLVNNPRPDGRPWGTKTSNNSNPYHEAPNTGVTRHYQFTLSRAQKAPDGYQKDVILINGQFPGPKIEANWGDWIEVQMTNNISSPEEGTALHWHGLLQTATPCYRFRADLYGTSWYHSHYSGQYAGGLLGPMIIYGPTNYDYDIDLGPVMLSDYYHKEYFEIIKELESTNQNLWRQYSDNNLINGKKDFNCSSVTDGRPCTDDAPLSKFRFQKGKAHRLRLINSGAEGQQYFSIHGHEMTVIANDFVPIEPYTTKTVVLGIGQRSDVVVQATGDVDRAYWMRSKISTICSLANQSQALAEIYYDEANITKQPTTQPWPYTDSGKCNNDDLALTIPFYPITPDPKPAKTIEVLVDFVTNSTGYLEWRLNQQPFRGNYNKPLLLLAQEQTAVYESEWNVVQPGQSRTVRLIVNNNPTVSHPMHLHGHNMYILHEGDGYWNDHSLTNTQNPQRRDVQMLRPGGHIVIQYDADNPGVWPFHCHIAWHLSSGLYMNILERPDDITSLSIQDIMSQTCKDWDAYTARAAVDQIDSGLKGRK